MNIEDNQAPTNVQRGRVQRGKPSMDFPLSTVVTLPDTETWTFLYDSMTPGFQSVMRQIRQLP